MLSAVLFDMDGVLIDSQPLHYLGDQQTLAAYGVSASLEEMVPYAGTTNQHRFGLFRERYRLDAPIDEMIARREEIMIRLVRESSEGPVRGIPELLGLLRKAGIPMAVASSSSYPFIYAVLDKLALRDYFDLIFSGEHVPKGKPAPDVFLETAARLGIPPEECLVVEDSANGVLAAVRAGMRCIGYRNPTSGVQDLSPADRVIDDFTGLDLDQLRACFL